MKKCPVEQKCSLLFEKLFPILEICVKACANHVGLVVAIIKTSCP